MSQDEKTTTSRRNVLRAGTLGLAGAIVLAACSDENPDAGLSGSPVPTTATPPTVPTTVPSATAIENDAIQLRTLRSIELLVAEVYTKRTGDLKDARMAAMASRFGGAHDDAAQFLSDAIDERDDDDIVDDGTANAYLQENMVDPVSEQLVDDVAILAFFQELESSLAATYINSVGIFTTAEWRQQAMIFGAADARRVTVLANAGEGNYPEDPVYPATDLVPGDAFLGPKKAQADGS
ncbi:hypothetical protein BH10ACT1_BH10ACT1_00120 [soil metagenome]